MNLKESFKEFQSRATPREFSHYEIDNDLLLLDVFHVYKESSLLDKTGKRLSESQPYPIAKVIDVGKDLKDRISVGDYVRLKDADARFRSNPVNEVWKENPLNKSNMEKQGPTPDKFINDFQQTFSRNFVIPNPFDANSSAYSESTYIAVMPMYFWSKIKNPEQMIDYLN